MSERGRFGEPWSAWEDAHYNREWFQTHYDIRNASGEFIGHEREQVERSVACVNALSGCNPEALDGLVEAVRKDIEARHAGVDDYTHLNAVIDALAAFEKGEEG